MGDLWQKFPRWLGPVLGAGLGAGLALRGMRRQGAFDGVVLVCGILCGALAGSVLWLVDAPSPTAGRRVSGLGSLLAALAVFPWCLPFVGLLFGVPAFLMNRRVVGWQNTASRLGLGLNIVMMVVVVVASQMPRE